MPTRTEVIQALRARDELQNRDIAQILDYLEQEAGSSSSTRGTILRSRRRTQDEITPRDLRSIYDYLAELGTPASTSAEFIQGVRRRDIMSIALANHMMDLIDGASFFPDFMANAPIALRVDQLSTLWLDAAGTMPALGTLDEQIERIDNSGTLSFSLTENGAGEHAFYTPAGIGTKPALRGAGGTSLTGVPGGAFTTAAGGMAIAGILQLNASSFTSYMELLDGSNDGWEISQSGNSVTFERNGLGAGASASAADDAYFFYNWQVDGTRGNSDASWAASAPPIASIGFSATAGDISAAATLALFSTIAGGANSTIRWSELYAWDRVLTTQEENTFTAYAESNYGITHD